MRPNGAQSFYTTAVEEIAQFEPRVVAFTSMCLNTHVSILLAKEIKNRLPDAITIVGGSHFSAITDQALQLYPWLNAAVVGEGESAFAEFLQDVRQSNFSSSRQVYRGSSFFAEPTHPHEAYRLANLDEYFAANPRRVVDYEGGRGCRYRCAFCYSPNHYNRARDVSVDRVVEDLSRLSSLGAKHLFFVQDNFVNDYEYAISLCMALAKASLPITFNCYVTLPQLDENLVESLAMAGCVNVYFGIDAVASQQMRVFNKRFYHSDCSLVSAMQQCANVGMVPTAAFIADLFDYDKLDLEHVFRTAAACSAAGAAIRINTFTRYPNTALGGNSSTVARYSTLKPQILLDCPKTVCDNPLAVQNPLMFPFHASEVQESVWLERLRLIHGAQNIIQSFPRRSLRIGPRRKSNRHIRFCFCCRPNPSPRRKVQLEKIGT